MTIKGDITNEKIEEIVQILNDNPISSKKLPAYFKKYNNGKELFNVFKIPINLLRYNKRNGRISTFLNRYKNEIDSWNYDKLNLEIEKFIINNDLDAHNQTTANIKLQGQQEPGIILDNGIVIDGNRRFTSLRKLNKEDENYKYFEAIILDSSLIPQNEIKLLEWNIQLGKEEKKNYDPINRYLDMYIQIEIDNSFTIEQYCQATNSNVKEMENEIKNIELIKEWLEYINAKNDWELAREYRIYDHFKEIQKMCKKLKNSTERNIAKKVLFDYVTIAPHSKDSKTVRQLANDIYSLRDSRDLETFFEKHQTMNNKIREQLNNNKSDSRENIENLRKNEEIIKKMISNKEMLTHKKLLTQNLNIFHLPNICEEFLNVFSKKYDLEQIKDYYDSSDREKLKNILEKITELCYSKIKELNEE